MFFLIKSLVLGSFFGFLYGFLFVGRLKKLFKENQNQKKQNLVGKNYKRSAIFNFSIFSSLAHLFLIILFAFLLFRINVNMFATLISFMFFFWWKIFKGLAELS